MNTAILILCHQIPHYWLAQARANPQCRFYLHYDLRSDITPLQQAAAELPNVLILPERHLIHWAGFSMVAATLLLIRTALTESENRFFHLVSGSCVALHSLNDLNQQWQKLPENSLFLNSHNETRLRYRLRFNTPHADTAWQRSLGGKILTKCYQIADRILPTSQIAPSGSQWFSAGRAALEWIMQTANTDTQNFFRHKLCPDEHFFQFLLANKPSAPLLHHNDNRRFIRFHGNNNHPETLDLATLIALYGTPDHWFARKADNETALALFKQNPSQSNREP